MKIVDHSFMFEQNERLKSRMLSQTPVETVGSVEPVNNNQNTSKQEFEEVGGVSLELSKEGRIADRQQNTSVNFSTTDFSTEEVSEVKTNSSNTNADNSVLNRYNFFVKTNHYDGPEGVVKRIFR